MIKQEEYIKQNSCRHMKIGFVLLFIFLLYHKFFDFTNFPTRKCETKSNNERSESMRQGVAEK